MTTFNINILKRGLAQFGSAHGLGPWGRGFESLNPDHVGTDFAPFRFFFSKKNQSHAPSFLLFRKKARQVARLVCKRTRSRFVAYHLFASCAFGAMYHFWYVNPRRSKLYIACSVFFAKIRVRSCRCSSFFVKKHVRIG